MKARIFASAASFRRWFDKHHSTTIELQVGFYKKSSGHAGLTYPEAVDEALCFGWIDGIVRKLDTERFTHRFTPRRPGSIWSNINVGHVARLNAADRMHAAGLAAFAARSAAKTGIYSYERREPPSRPQKLPRDFERVFRADPSAWSFWQAQPTGYRRTVIRWIVSARQAATRRSRLARRP